MKYTLFCQIYVVTTKQINCELIYVVYVNRKIIPKTHLMK